MQSEQGLKKIYNKIHKEAEVFQTPIPDSPGTTGRLVGGLGGASRPCADRFVFDSSRAQMGGSLGTNPSQEYRSGRGWAG